MPSHTSSPNLCRLAAASMLALNPLASPPGAESLSRRPTLEFLKTEAASGLILAAAAVAALVVANSPWASDYFSLIHAPFTVRIGPFEETADVLDWVKHGLMAIFFFVVGMEIKYEVLKGELANPRRLAMPLLAAVGGTALPALI